MIDCSLLDTDYYKLTMMQCVFHRFPNIPVKYEFKLRNYPGTILLPHIKAIDKEIGRLSELSFTEKELDYLRSLEVFKEDFLEYLRHFQIDTGRHVTTYYRGDEFRITIEGNWLDTILFEVPILAIVSETYSSSLGEGPKLTKMIEYGARALSEKIERIKGTSLKFSDFGTRRRFSLGWQHHVVSELARALPNNFIGTSNVLMAKKYGLQPIGTMAHEFIQAGQGLAPPRESQRYMLNQWLQEYNGKLGIALTDTIGMDAFLMDFDKKLANAYTGCRQDSGDPFVWGHKLINHYQHLGIDPMTKTSVFSDNLNIEKAMNIHETFSPYINVVFGIGTNLTNDMGFKAPQIVLKMAECNGRPVAKISDSPGKSMCADADYVRRLKEMFAKEE